MIWFWKRRNAERVAQQAIDSLQRAVTDLENLRVTTERLLTEVVQLRAELVAYDAASMEDEVQVAELKRIFDA